MVPSAPDTQDCNPCTIFFTLLPEKFISQKHSAIDPHHRGSCSARSFHSALPALEGSSARDWDLRSDPSSGRGDSLHCPRRECFGHRAYWIREDRGCSSTTHRQDGPGRESTGNLTSLYHSTKSTKPRSPQTTPDLVSQTGFHGRGETWRHSRC